jgi:hypothetical protein
MLRHPAQSLPWLGIIILLAGVLIAMIARKLSRIYAAFMTYLAVVLLFEAAAFWLMYIYSGPRTRGLTMAYWIIFWVGEILKGIACVLVLSDLYYQLFRDYEGLRRFSKALFRWVAALLLLVSSLIAATTHANIDWLTRLVLVIDATASIFVCGFLIFLFALSSYFTLGWRHYAIGIAIGLAIQTPLLLATQLIQLQFGYTAVPTISVLIKAAYVVTLLIWMGYLALPQPRLATAAAPPHHTLDHWNQTLLRYMR